MNVLRKTAAMLLVATQASGGTLLCDDPRLSTSGGDDAIRLRTCEAASKALDQLQSCNVILNRSVEIRIVDNFDHQPTACLGLYHCGEDRIDILTPKAMSLLRDKEGAFERVDDTPYWDSVLAHELTHAVYDTVNCPFTSCVATDEYAAYAMQVYTLPKNQQAQFGKSVTLRSAASSDAISAVMLFMAPDRFAKIAWLHFQKQSHPCVHMQKIMDGQIFYDREPL